MPWDKNSEEAFPSMHPREPGGLRQDILDEIADHLACATARELEQDETGDEETVWRRVLDKFGDPDTVARRLWWDQMRETVMREWIQTGVMIVVGLAIVVFMAVVVRQMNTSNQTVLEALRGNSIATNPLVSFTVKVTRGNDTGKPAAGVNVRISGAAFGTDTTTIQRETDASGTAVFGPMQPGTYSVYMEDPLSGMFMEPEETTCFAGELDGMVHLIAPDAAPREIRLNFDEPVSLENDRLIHVAMNTVWKGGSNTWRSNIEGWLNEAGQWGRDPDPTDTVQPDQLGVHRNRIENPDWQAYTRERYPLALSGAVKRVELLLAHRDDNGALARAVTTTVEAPEITPSEDGATFTLPLPDAFSHQLEQWRAEDHAAAQGIALDGALWGALREVYTDMVVDSTERVEEMAWGLWSDGKLNHVGNVKDILERAHVSCAMGVEIYTDNGAHQRIEGVMHTVVALPMERTIAPAARLILALYKTNSKVEEFDNDLQFWPVMNSVFFTPGGTDGETPGGGLPDLVVPIVADAPALSLSTDELGDLQGNSRWLLFDLTDLLVPVEAGAQPTAVLLKWANGSLRSDTVLSMISAGATTLGYEDLRPRWLVLKPME